MTKSKTAGEWLDDLSEHFGGDQDIFLSSDLPQLKKMYLGGLSTQAAFIAIITAQDTVKFQETAYKMLFGKGHEMVEQTAIVAWLLRRIEVLQQAVDDQSEHRPCCDGDHL
jgi:hypothetical protein